MKSLLILFIGAIVVLFAGLGKKKGLLQPLALIASLLALGASVFDLNMGDATGLNERYADMFGFDQYALVFTAVTLVAVSLLIGLTGWGFRTLSDTLGDNLGLILFSVCGALVMFSFQNLTMLFLGIEILSIPLYVLAGSRRDDLASNEAALKYFLMGSFATGILLFGMALVYGATASFDLTRIAAAISDGQHSAGMLNVGILLILIGLSFKISAAPFHFWAPDVYEGSPNLITAFMSTVVKTAGIAAFYRLFAEGFIGAQGFWSTAVAAISAMTMVLANTTAIFQNNFKRMMAYSSISHAGYLLLGILSIGNAASNGAGALLFYTLTYSIATICAFAAYMVVAEQNRDGSFAAFNGLGKKQPLLALMMTIAMLSLAGIPPTAGFFGKYFLFTSALDEYPWLVVLAVINSAISIYYYFKVIIAMYFSREENDYAAPVPAGFRWVMLTALVLIALLTILPGSVYALI
ncbi:MAG: NADH-quinone oxidoreductase subunit N [Saprospiraceae bacterium]|nr:NADH-quinone oxidoreductase subunit N [Saprospiraceae bacterium]